jgi:WXXGXW repeat (2 copies)
VRNAVYRGMKTAFITGLRAVGAVAFAIAMAGLFASCTRTVVESAPPPPQQEVIVAQPGPDYVWVGGYWGWSWGHYSWIGGHWAAPPHPHAAWEGARWEHRDGHYVFVEGRWR